MKLISSAVLLALASAGINAVAGPVGVVVNFYTSFGSGVNGSAQIAAKQFDPSLGALTNIQIIFDTGDAGFSEGATLFNHGSSPASFSFQEAASETIDVFGNTAQASFNAAISGTLPATPFNGVSCGGRAGPPIGCLPLVNGVPQFPSFLPTCGFDPNGPTCILTCTQLDFTCSASPEGFATLSLGPLGPFIGTGTIDIPATFSYSQTLTSPDGVTNVISGPVVFTEVIYFYTPAGVSAAPEPAALGLAGIGLAAMIAGRRRRTSESIQSIRRLIRNQ